MYTRALNLNERMQKKSHFLFGPRSTGKSSLIKSQLKDSLVLDLLDEDIFEELLRRPKALAEKIKHHDQIVVIDEVQKLPKILDEVHRLIEDRKLKFLLTGSSARKIRRGHANLLGGRARELSLFPLTSHEISDFKLDRYLSFGGLPAIYLSDEPIEDLKSYCRTYLSEEIKAEALVRNYDRFVRFLETMALSNGLEINYQAISSDAGVPIRTLEGYIEVLKDTLIGFELFPFQKTLKRKAKTHSKFYFFDTGVANFLSGKMGSLYEPLNLDVAFEQFIIQEVRAYISYRRILKDLSFWRTRSYEVDLIIGSEVGVEVKNVTKIKDEHFKGLRALKEENILRAFYVVGRFESEGDADGITYLNYKNFLKKLWSGQII
jgi:predicted AAA+ superfamily ATPase